MNDTEQLFVAAAVWTIIAVVIARYIPIWPGRIAFVAIAVGLPFWELPYGYYNFQKLCREEGLLRVFEPIEPQKSLCADYPFDASAKSLYRYGFANIEARGKAGEVFEILRSTEEAHRRRNPGILNSNYCVTYVNNIPLPWRVVRHDFLITRAKDATVIARHSVFDWGGMWWQDVAARCWVEEESAVKIQFDQSWLRC